MSDAIPDAGTPLAQYQALLDVSELISRHSDLAALFHDLAPRLRQVVAVDYIGVLLHDATANVMRLHVLERSPGEQAQPDDFAPLESPGGEVWRTQEPVLMPDFDEDAHYPLMHPIWQRFGIKSGYYLPLTTAQRRLGAIHFATFDRHAFQPQDLHLFGQVARQVALAVDNALHFQEVQCYQRQLGAERDRLRLLLEVNNAVVSHLDLNSLCQAIAACLRRVVRQEYTSLSLRSPRGGWQIHALDFPTGRGLIREQQEFPWEGAPASAAVNANGPVVMRRADLEALSSDVARLLLAEGIASLCSVPLTARRQILGTLNVGRLRDDDFPREDIEMLVQVAGQLALAVDNALAFEQISALKNKLNEEKLYLEDEIRTEYNFTEIVGSSPSLQRVLHEVEVVAPADTPVLIQGETGTGKELIARAIHHLSRRRERTFVKVNCAAIPTGLLESEMFGHEKGAFTGAVSQKVGRFELANGGTLFLDEIGDIPPELQPKLLRVLQEQEFERLGSTRTIKVDVRLVAATNRDLAEMVGRREFRGDLFYRLNVFPVTLPALRERAEDIPQLVRYFVQRHGRRLGKTIRSISAEAMTDLTRYQWPGNVRELENFIERAVLLSTGPELRVSPEDLKAGPDTGATGAVALAEAERQHILHVLKLTNWVIGGANGAAARLGLKRTTLQSKMQKLGIVKPREQGG